MQTASQTINKSPYQAGNSLYEKLQNPDINDALGKLLDKVQSVEIMVSALDEMLHKMPLVFQSFAQESPYQNHNREALALLEKISQPETMRSLSRLLDKLDTVDTLLSLSEEGLNKMPQIVDSIQKESPLNTRLDLGLELIDKLTQAENLKVLSHILDRLDSVDTLTSALDEAMKKSGQVLESLHKESILGDTIVQYMKIGEKLAHPQVVHNFNNLLDKIQNLDAVLNILDGIFKNNPQLANPESPLIKGISELVQVVLDNLSKDHTLVQTIGGGLELLNELNQILLSDKMQMIVRGLAKAMETKKHEVEPLGLFGLVKMLNDKDVQEVLGLVYILLKSIGIKFKEFECPVNPPTDGIFRQIKS